MKYNKAFFFASVLVFSSGFVSFANSLTVQFPLNFVATNKAIEKSTFLPATIEIKEVVIQDSAIKNKGMVATVTYFVDAQRTKVLTLPINIELKKDGLIYGTINLLSSKLPTISCGPIDDQNLFLNLKFSEQSLTLSEVKVRAFRLQTPDECNVEEKLSVIEYTNKN